MEQTCQFTRYVTFLVGKFSFMHGTPVRWRCFAGIKQLLTPDGLTKSWQALIPCPQFCTNDSQSNLLSILDTRCLFLPWLFSRLYLSLFYFLSFADKSFKQLPWLGQKKGNDLEGNDSNPWNWIYITTYMADILGRLAPCGQQINPFC